MDAFLELFLGVFEIVANASGRGAEDFGDLRGEQHPLVRVIDGHQIFYFHTDNLLSFNEAIIKN